MNVTAVLLIGMLIVVIIECVYISNDDDCGQEFRLDGIITITVNYEGGLHNKKCPTKFTLDDTYDHEICVQPVSLNLDCNTEIEYRKYSVSDYSNDGILTCYDNHDMIFDETCASYISSYWLVIKRTDSYYGSAESAEIRVYTKKRHIESYSGSGEDTRVSWAAIIVPMILGTVLIIGGFAVFLTCYRIRLQRRYRNTGTAAYTVAASAPPANQPAYQHSGYMQQSGQCNNVQTASGGYHVHPMVSAYPNQTQQSPAQYGNQSVPYNNQHAPYNNQPGQFNNQSVPYNNQHAPYNNQPGQFNNQSVSYNNQAVSQQQQQRIGGPRAPTAHLSAPRHGDSEMPPPSYESLGFK